jgi:hypothetical protein
MGMNKNTADTIQTARSQRGGPIVHLVVNADPNAMYQRTACGREIMHPLVGWEGDADKAKCPKCVKVVAE